MRFFSGKCNTFLLLVSIMGTLLLSGSVFAQPEIIVGALLNAAIGTTPTLTISSFQSGLTVKLGATVNMSFHASQALQTSPSPRMYVNNHAATYINQVGDDYYFQYTIASTDADGYATVRAEGNALDDNDLGTATMSNAFKVDKTAPVISSVSIGPPQVKSGSSVTIMFTTSETLLENPTVNITSGTDSFPATYWSKAGNRYTYYYVVNQSKDTETAKAVDIHCSDLAGNSGSKHVSNAFTCDFTAPALYPMPEIQNTYVKTGSVISLFFTCYETLASSPAPMMYVNDHPATFVSHSGYNYNYTYTIQASDPEGQAVIVSKGYDAAGNMGTLTNPGYLSCIVDNVAPKVKDIMASPYTATGINEQVNVLFTTNEPIGTSNTVVQVNGKNTTGLYLDHVQNQEYTYSCTYTTEADDYNGPAVVTVSAKDYCSNQSQLYSSKTAFVINYNAPSYPSSNPSFATTITLDSLTGTTVSPRLFGSNTHCITAHLGMTKTTQTGYTGDMTPGMVEDASALGVSMLRFPGGHWAEDTHWRDGVGPGDRPVPEEYEGKYDTTRYGTDEFLKYCQDIGCPNPLITVNCCKGTAQEAANWVEYCNGIVDLDDPLIPTWTPTSYTGSEEAPAGYFAWLRYKLTGRLEPYNVQYWEIGNEIYSFRKKADGTFVKEDESGYATAADFTAADYAARVREYSIAMKSKSPISMPIKIGVVGLSRDSDYDNTEVGELPEIKRWQVWNDARWYNWNKDLLASLANLPCSIDFISPHYYSSCGGVYDYFRYIGGDRYGIVCQPGTYTLKMTAKADYTCDSTKKPHNPESSETCICQKSKIRIFVDHAPVYLPYANPPQTEDYSLDKADEDFAPVMCKTLPVSNSGPVDYEYTFTIPGQTGNPSLDQWEPATEHWFYISTLYNGQVQSRVFDVTLRSDIIPAQSLRMPEQSLSYPKDTELQMILMDETVLKNRLSGGTSYDGITINGLKHYLSGNTEIIPTEGSYSGSTNGVDGAVRFKGAFWLSAYYKALINSGISSYCHWNLFDDGCYGMIRIPYYTADGNTLVTPSYYATKLFTTLADKNLMNVSIGNTSNPCPVYYYPTASSNSTDYRHVPLHDTPTRDNGQEVQGIERPSGLKYLDAVACKDGNSAYLIVTNRSNRVANVTLDASLLGSYSGTTVETLRCSALYHSSQSQENTYRVLEAYNDNIYNDNDVVEVTGPVSVSASDIHSIPLVLDPFTINLVRVNADTTAPGNVGVPGYPATPLAVVTANTTISIPVTSNERLDTIRTSVKVNGRRAKFVNEVVNGGTYTYYYDYLVTSVDQDGDAAISVVAYDRSNLESNKTVYSVPVAFHIAAAPAVSLDDYPSTSVKVTDDVVTIKVRSLEHLNTTTSTVTVNGNNATLSGSETINNGEYYYTYTYTITSNDQYGQATIAVDARDLEGNLSQISCPNAFVIDND